MFRKTFKRFVVGCICFILLITGPRIVRHFINSSRGNLSSRKTPETSGDWVESGNEYHLEGQGPKLLFTIETKAGTVTLQNP